LRQVLWDLWMFHGKLENDFLSTSCLLRIGICFL
jgi:hypothetical protein